MNNWYQKEHYWFYYCYLWLMEWAEVLPLDCPPTDAVEPKHVYFRLGSEPPGEGDFWSHRRRFPTKSFAVTECVATSLSIFNDVESLRTLRRLIPAMRKKSIIELELSPEHGAVLQTGSNRHHFSWWRSLAFDITTIKIVHK